MQRILEPGEIEARSGRAFPRIRLPDRGLFARRAARLRQLADGHAIGDYLRLIAALADAQQHALANLEAPPPDAASRARAREHAMPLVPAGDWPRASGFDARVRALAAAVVVQPGFPAGVATLAARIVGTPRDTLVAQADALLASRHADIDVALAPFVAAALQVHGVALATELAPEDLAPLDPPVLCPLCGTAPVASIVRTGRPHEGHRFLQCALCATEWHMVRAQCSHCLASKTVGYHTIEGGGGAVRAESCDDCHTYRKIIFEEKDAAVEPLADDLASLALDLLLGEAGYRRSSPHPLLWLPLEH